MNETCCTTHVILSANSILTNTLFLESELVKSQILVKQLVYINSCTAAPGIEADILLLLPAKDKGEKPVRVPKYLLYGGNDRLTR